VTVVPPIKVVLYCGVSSGAEEIYTCTAKFGSWTYSGNKVGLANTGGVVDLSDYTENERWEISNSTVVRHSLVYDCCPEEYAHLAYTLELKPKHHRHHCD
ncbi:hypothetical protein GA512_21430, partial [Bacillus paralicheniformis]|nr:hypothetical protein [Bacillus paralicheniformis]